MAVQLILMDDVEFLGKIGDTVTVRDGYARNYLLPKGLAEPLTKNALRKLEKIRKEREELLKIRRAEALDKAGKLKGQTLTIAVKAVEGDEEGKLYGSVSAADIAKAQQQTGKEYFLFKKPLKFWGEDQDLEEMLSFGFVEGGICLGYDKELIDEDGYFCGEALEDWMGGYTFVDILELLATIYDTLGIEPDNRLVELIDKHIEERTEAEKAAIELAEKKQTERNVGYIGIDSLFTLDMDCYYYEDEEDDLEGFYINNNINSVKAEDGKLWVTRDSVEELEEQDEYDDPWTELSDWCRNYKVDLNELYKYIKYCD